MLLVTVSLAITAVPVLARILADRNMAAAADGRLALAAAVIIDAASWPLLAVAIAIDAGVSGDAARPMAALAIGVTSAVIMRAIMRRPLFGRLCVHLPRAVPLLLGLAAVIGSAGTEHYGLTAIFGAVLVGMVVPPDSPAAPWSDSVRAVARTGRFLVPVYFVVTGMTILNGPPGASTWVALLPAMALAIGLAVVGKVGGGYLGARLGGRPHLSALRVGVLVNTRGLTEIVVVQAGYSAGILTAGIYLALIVMALVTTALTVPLLSLIDNAQGRKEPVSGARRAVGAQP
jgi:Kef-type K+ transport system membrane component KefB